MRRHEAVVSGSEEGLERERGAGDAARIRAPDGLEADRRVELPQDPGPERLAVDAEGGTGLERRAELVRRRSVGGVGGEAERREAGERDAGRRAQEGVSAGGRDQLSAPRLRWSSMGLP